MSRAIKAFASSETPVVIAVNGKQNNVEIASFVDEKSNVTVITNAKGKNFIPFSPLSGDLLNSLSNVSSSFDKNDIKAMKEVAVCKSCGSHLLSTAELASNLKGSRLHCVVCGEEVDVDEEDDEIEDENAADENEVEEIEDDVVESESDADESEEEPVEEEEIDEVEESSDDEEPKEDIEEDDIEIEESDLDSEEEINEVKDDEVEESADEEENPEEVNEEEKVEEEVEESSDEEGDDEEIELTDDEEPKEDEVEADTTNVEQQEIDEENGVETSNEEPAEPEQLADETNASADDEESEDDNDDEDEELPDEEISASVKKRINLNMFDGVDVKSSTVDLIKVRNEGKYYIMSNSKPVATLNKELASEEVQSFFDNESNMRAALNASLDNGFTKEVCANFGLKPIKVSFRASKAVRQEIAKVKSKLASEALASVETYKQRYAQALSIASVGVNKSIYGSNILRDALAKQGVLAGMVDAEDVVNEMFAKYGEDYIKEIISKANELVEKSDEARNAEASVVANASFNCTVSKSVAKRLGSHIPVESKVIEVEASAKTNGYSKLF